MRSFKEIHDAIVNAFIAFIDWLPPRTSPEELQGDLTETEGGRRVRATASRIYTTTATRTSSTTITGRPRPPEFEPGTVENLRITVSTFLEKHPEYASKTLGLIVDGTQKGEPEVCTRIIRFKKGVFDGHRGRKIQKSRRG